MRYLDFWVSIGLGLGDSGDVCVSVEVNDFEYAHLKECCRKHEEMSSYRGLKRLSKRVRAAAIDENEMLMDEYSPGEKINYDYAYFSISIPDKIRKIVEEEQKEKA